MNPQFTEEDADLFDDLLQSSSSDTYSPPPHIAARIYKSGRPFHRKSSATSSRRSSITSHHSNRSGLSAHGGPHSTHIAQHLRRASIIESRKAKAADRNAHAEKVRLRAAMNKAAPRITTADSEERATAAQQARERYLEQVRASCAAEVRRSKKVAEEQREKRAAEHLKLKEGMEERHAQAERRRALIDQNMRRPRAINASTTARSKKGYVWKPRSQVEAVRILQVAWRDFLRRVEIKRFLELGLSVDAVRKLSFEETGERLNQEDVIDGAGRLLVALGLVHKSSEDPTQIRATARTLLSAFLILAHPAQVLNKDGEQEKDLLSKSEEVLLHLNAVFETLSLIQVPCDSKTSLMTELSGAYIAFQQAFAAWRTQDSSFMITNMVAQFVELDAIWQSVKDDTPDEVAADYREGIQHNQTLVLARLKKLAGPERAMKLIREAVKSRRKLRAKEKAANAKPLKPMAVAKEAPRTPGSASLEAVDLIASTSSTLAETHSRTLAQSVQDRTTAKELLHSTTLVPESRTIVHELAINKEWKIDVAQREGNRDEIIAGLSAQLQQGLDSGFAEIWIPALAESIEQKISNMLMPDKPFQVMVREALDPQLVLQQVKSGIFSYHNFFDFMNSILPKLCAPVRDDEIKALSQRSSENPVEQLARIYFIIDLMVLDMLNFQLVSMAPAMLKEAAGYEARAFERELLGKSPERTMVWWRESARTFQEETLRRSPDSSSSLAAVTGAATAASNTPRRIYNHGLVELAISPTSLSLSTMPETLRLDTVRLQRLRATTRHMLVVSAILLNAKALLRRDTRSLWKSEASRMVDLLITHEPQQQQIATTIAPSQFISIIESRYALPPTTKTNLTHSITKLLAQFTPSSTVGSDSETTNSEPTNPVLRVLLKKLKSHVSARLNANSEEERTRLASTATEVLGASGMIEFVGKIGEMIGELGRMGMVDWEAHESWYEKIIEQVG